VQNKKYLSESIPLTHKYMIAWYRYFNTVVGLNYILVKVDYC